MLWMPEGSYERRGGATKNKCPTAFLRWDCRMSPPVEAARADVVTIMTTVLIGLAGALTVLFQALTSERSEKGSTARSTWCVVACCLVYGNCSIELSLIMCVFQSAAPGWRAESTTLQNVHGKCSTCTMVLYGLPALR
jgi:hypothetical protein